jgi:hypothetical protein
VLDVEWVDERTYALGADIVLARNKRELSLVDCVSFVVMTRLGIRDVFTFDPHFRREGFKCRPEVELGGTQVPKPALDCWAGSYRDFRVGTELGRHF